MKILLDTHIFLLALAQLQRAIRDRNTQYPILKNYQWVDRPLSF